MSGRYKYFFFDMDGTIIQSEYGVMDCFRHALERFGIDPGDNENLRKCIGPPLYYSFTEFFGLSPEDGERAVDFYREKYNDTGLFESPLYDGFYEMTEALHKKGYHLAVVTSKPQIPAERIAKHHGLYDFYDAIIAPTEAESATADKTELINRAIAELSVADPAEVVMVGDRKYDILGAIGAGVDSIGAVYGYGSREELMEAGATYLVDHPREILLLPEVV